MDVTYRSQKIGAMSLAVTGGPTTTTGFDIVSVSIPFDIRLEASDTGRHWVLSDLTIQLQVQRPDGTSRLLGSGSHVEMFMSATGPMELRRHIVCHCSPRGLAQYEVLRNGSSARLRCEVRGRVCSLYEVSGRHCLSNPSPVFGWIDIEFPAERWAAALRPCGLSASVLIEVPLPGLQEATVDDGMRSLLDAFEAFDRGGPTAWKDCVGHIRPFLEKWKNDEPLPATDPRDGSAADRSWKLLNLRDALYKCCHFWVHETKAACTREDALLVLGAYASLLRTTRH